MLSSRRLRLPPPAKVRMVPADSWGRYGMAAGEAVIRAYCMALVTELQGDVPGLPGPGCVSWSCDNARLIVPHLAAALSCRHPGRWYAAGWTLGEDDQED